MEKYICELCGYVYDPTVGDPDNDIAEGTEFDELSEDWVCPLCGAAKDDFEKMTEEEDIRKQGVTDSLMSEEI